MKVSQVPFIILLVVFVLIAVRCSSASEQGRVLVSPQPLSSSVKNSEQDRNTLIAFIKSIVESEPEPVDESLIRDEL